MEVGRGAGRAIAAAVASASRRIWISSPWIGASYVKVLVDKALAGVDVRVITTDLPDNEGRDLARAADLYGEEELKDAALRVAHWRRRRGSARVAAVRDPLLSFSFALALAYLESVEPRYAWLLLAAAASLAAAGVALAIYRVRALRRIEAQLLAAEAELERINRSLAAAREAIRRGLKALVVPTNVAFVHAKIYIVDDRAWISSANLTDSGVARNIEVIAEVDLAEAARRFEELWATLSAELSRRS